MGNMIPTCNYSSPLGILAVEGFCRQDHVKFFFPKLLLASNLHWKLVAILSEPWEGGCGRSQLAFNFNSLKLKRQLLALAPYMHREEIVCTLVYQLFWIFCPLFAFFWASFQPWQDWWQHIDECLRRAGWTSDARWKSVLLWTQGCPGTWRWLMAWSVPYTHIPAQITITYYTHTHLHKHKDVGILDVILQGKPPTLFA